MGNTANNVGHRLATQDRPASQFETYLISGIALVLAVLALIIACIAEWRPVNIQNIATQNGFSAIKHGETATLFTTARGVLKGQAGILQRADDTDITAALLTNFVIDSSGDPVTAGDSILSALEKCTVLNQTTLGSWTPGAGTITPFDTVLQTLQKLAGNQGTLSFYGVTTIAETTATPIWSSATLSPPVYPPVLAANNFAVGGAFELTADGFSTISTTGTITLQLVLTGASPVTFNVVSMSLAAGSYLIRYQASVTCRTAGVAGSILLIGYLTAIDATGASITNGNSAVSTGFDTTQATTVVLNGLVSNVTNNFTLNTSVGRMAFSS